MEGYRNNAGPSRSKENWNEISRARHHHRQPVAFLEANFSQLSRAIDRFGSQTVPAQEIFLAVTADETEALLGTAATLFQGEEQVFGLFRWQLTLSQTAYDLP